MHSVKLAGPLACCDLDLDLVCTIVLSSVHRRRRRLGQRRRRIVHEDVESESGSDRSDSSGKENHATSTDVSPLQPSEKPAGRGRRRRPVEFGGCVYVGSLPHHTRVSEFKAEVRDHNVNPLRVLWRGNNGFAFLNFRTLEEAELALEALHGLQVGVVSLTLAILPLTLIFMPPPPLLLAGLCFHAVCPYVCLCIHP